ncbi:hypothetical protein SAMN04515620_101288 [Collimonas sp. OK607]|nr:hypothetical protein SAMN04515620_101288 [Collimonas sp. OK607]
MTWRRAPFLPAGRGSGRGRRLFGGCSFVGTMVVWVNAAAVGAILLVVLLRRSFSEICLSPRFDPFCRLAFLALRLIRLILCHLRCGFAPLSAGSGLFCFLFASPFCVVLWVALAFGLCLVVRVVACVLCLAFFFGVLPFFWGLVAVGWCVDCGICCLVYRCLRSGFAVFRWLCVWFCFGSWAAVLSRFSG